MSRKTKVRELGFPALSLEVAGQVVKFIIFVNIDKFTSELNNIKLF